VRGETGVLLVIAADMTQAATQLNYIKGTIDESPLLRDMVASETRDSLVLTNGIEIVVRAANFRRLRGLTAIGVIISESAFFFQEGHSNPDFEILNAVKPMLLTTGGSIYHISSPYSKSGVLWELYRRHYGPDGDPSTLVVQGSSLEFNKTLPVRIVEEALAQDPASASAEYLGQFRDDVQSYISPEVVRSCVSVDVVERAPAGHRYFAFVDPAGGSGKDSMTLAISHRDGADVVIDAVREVRPPFSPEAAVEEFCGVLQRYRVTTIGSDKYAADWPREQFRKRGITVVSSEKTASDLYREMLPRLNTRTIVLLDHPRLVHQISKLERRTSSASRDVITHRERVGHDDLANAVAGASFLADGGRSKGDVMVGTIGYDGRITWLHQRGRVSAFDSSQNGCIPGKGI
jgi:hypothetical protein